MPVYRRLEMEMGSGTVALIVVVALAVLVLIVLRGAAGMYRKVGPNRALIVYGKGEQQVIVGGGRLILPFVQSAQEFDLQLMNFDGKPTYDLNTTQGIPV